MIKNSNERELEVPQDYIYRGKNVSVQSKYEDGNQEGNNRPIAGTNQDRDFLQE